MSIINRLKRHSSAREDLGLYYDRIKAKHYSSDAVQMPVSRDEFINWFMTQDSKITYVIAYTRHSPVDPTIGSNIAKFEITKLCERDSRQFNFNLNVHHIPEIE